MKESRISSKLMQMKFMQRGPLAKKALSSAAEQPKVLLVLACTPVLPLHNILIATNLCSHQSLSFRPPGTALPAVRSSLRATPHLPPLLECSPFRTSILLSKGCRWTTFCSCESWHWPSKVVNIECRRRHSAWPTRLASQTAKAFRMKRWQIRLIWRIAGQLPRARLIAEGMRDWTQRLVLPAGNSTRNGGTRLMQLCQLCVWIV